MAVIFNLPEDENFAFALAEGLRWLHGQLDFHDFPDGETSIQVLSDIKDQAVFLVANLHHPNQKLIKLIFFAETVRANGAKSVVLIAPYLAYMRLDKISARGEGLTSQYFARVLSQHFDGLMTIDPHLHRYRSLADLYTLTTTAISAAPAVANWVWRHVENPVLIGPDEESAQWIKVIAQEAKVPYLVFKKKRYGDKSVSISAPLMAEYHQHTPVMIDDIISTASTMIQGVKVLQSSGMKPPICLGIHPVFAPGAKENLMAAGVAEIVTCNTIPHATNGIDLTPLVIDALHKMPASQP